MVTMSTPSDEVEIPFSILDTDLYKLTMQNAVLHHFHDAEVVIKFTNRAPHMLFNRKSFDWIQDRVNRLSRLCLTAEERTKLSETCSYFPETYLDYLTNISLNPREQVKLSFLPRTASDPNSSEGKGDDALGEIECRIQGVWRDCILYEVPVMSILSEGYFKFVDTDWNTDGVQEKAKQKALQLLSPGEGITPLSFSEFGTRRRRSYHVHDLVMKGLIEGDEEWKAGGGSGGGLVGTSNVYLALKYGVKPSGTIAHEWIMAIGAVYGYEHANAKAMSMWEEVYPPTPTSPLHTMLTDTYTVQKFFQDFTSSPQTSIKWNALRQDSGDPFVFMKEASKAWNTIQSATGVDVSTKRVVFSDGLDVGFAIKLQKGCDEIALKAAFGIGTFLTNDFTKLSDSTQSSKPLNIVIKLNQINGLNCVKISDDVGKHTGDPEEVERVKKILGISAVAA